MCSIILTLGHVQYIRSKIVLEKTLEKCHMKDELYNTTEHLC